MTDYKLTIRPARAEDQKAIRALIWQALLDPTAVHWQNFLVAEEDGEVIGCGQIKHYFGIRELASLVVQTDKRGQGIGSALVQALITYEPRELYLTCAKRLISYYRRFEFEVVPWRQVPGILKLKLALANTLGRIIFRTGYVVMKRSDGLR